jgi:hypothetical protein
MSVRQSGGSDLRSFLNIFRHCQCVPKEILPLGCAELVSISPPFSVLRIEGFNKKSKTPLPFGDIRTHCERLQQQRFLNPRISFSMAGQPQQASGPNLSRISRVGGKNGA